LLETDEMSRLALPIVAAFALLTGCSQSSPNDAPIVDYIDGPPAVSKTGGTYTIPLSIGFHDNDEEVVTHVHYHSGSSIDGIIEIPTPVPTRQSADITIVLVANERASGQHALEITVIDGRGAESRPFAQVVTLE
jgi:hypothetical protein